MAQKTRAQIVTEITTLLADNTTGDISAEDVRSVLTDIKDSFVNLDDDDSDDITEGVVKLFLTVAERSKLTNVPADTNTSLAAKLENVVEDTTPQLGGNLDANSERILNVRQIDSNSIVKNSQTLSITTGAATFKSGLGNFATITLTENTTIGFEITGGEELILEVIQDETGSRTLTFSDVLWAGGLAPTVTEAAGSVDVFRFITINETIYGSIIGQNMS